jgi:hypothetical protein
MIAIEICNSNSIDCLRALVKAMLIRRSFGAYMSGYVMLEE